MKLCLQLLIEIPDQGCTNLPHLFIWRKIDSLRNQCFSSRKWKIMMQLFLFILIGHRLQCSGFADQPIRAHASRHPAADLPGARRERPQLLPTLPGPHWDHGQRQAHREGLLWDQRVQSNSVGEASGRKKNQIKPSPFSSKRRVHVTE